MPAAHHGAQGAPGTTPDAPEAGASLRPAHGLSLRRRLASVVTAAAVVISGQAGLSATAVLADGTPAPRAVIIVGPSGMDRSNKEDANRIASQAADAGMRVTKVYTPNATWDRVVDATRGASLVVYMGHGNGWPSPHGPFQENTKDGFGLNPRPGVRSPTDYQGADKLRKRIRLAQNAVVLLVHLCYAAGNGEEYMGPERNRDTATKRVDNYASGFLDIGARAVFAFGMDQDLDMPRALMNTDRSMDDLFQDRSGQAMARYDGFVGKDDYYRDSKRVGWARIHMDPHPSKGHYRAVTGDLGMTASEFRAGAGTLAPKAGSPAGGSKKSKKQDRTAPKLKLTGANGSGIATSGSAVRFTPNGDGSRDTLRIRRSLTERARIRVQVRDRRDRLVRTFTRTAGQGTGTITWDGRNDRGKVVPEGRYTVRLTPRDTAGNKGTPRTLSAVVLTSLKRVTPNRRAIDASDRDKLGESVRVAFTLSQKAKVRIQVRDSKDRVVRTALGGSFKAGRHAWRWDGKDSKGRFVADGAYRVTVRSTTSAGSMSQTHPIHVGAFRILTSEKKVKRGQRLRVTIVSTEPLRGAPTLTVRQPGSVRTVATKKVEAGRFTTRIRVKEGKAGTLRLKVKGTDRAGGKQVQARDLRLR